MWLLLQRQRTRKGHIMTTHGAIRQEQLEKELLEKEQALAQKSQKIEEMAVSLRVMMEQGHVHRDEIEANVLHNVDQVVLPLIDRLKSTLFDKHQKRIVTAVESSLKSLVSPFARNAMVFKQFSPKELQVANLVRLGRSNRKIADMLGVSINTVVTHRYRIRSKLGIKNKRVNLRSYLLEMDMK